MRSLVGVCAAVASLTVMGAAASAADIAPVPEPVATGGFYIGGFGGATWFDENNSDFDFSDGGDDYFGDVSLDIDTGYIFGGVLGWNWADTGLRPEVEVSYSSANVDEIDVDFDAGSDTVLNEDIDLDADLSVLYVMGNLWYDFGGALDMGGFSPYLGGGLGVGFVDFDLDGDFDGIDFDGDSDETGFAYQAGGGIRWNMTESAALDLGYRWKGVTLDDFDDLQSSNVTLGFTFGF